MNDYSLVNGFEGVSDLYGIVLEGGGARGAYQVGAWQALRELGLEYGGVAGTSVGALNGAMMVQGDIDRALEIWSDIRPSRIVSIDEALYERLKRLEISIVTLTGNLKSTLAEASDVTLDVSVKEEACSLNLAPTASTTVAMAIGDALAISLLEKRGFCPDDFAALHPAGRLGNKLLRVEHLMHSGEAMPRVATDTAMPAVFHEMSAKKLGMTTVTTPEGKLAGILTDGDLRRLMEKHGGATLAMTAGDCMVRTPQTIGPKILASEALNLMEKKKITSVVVVDPASQKVVGVVHLHDLWTLELM